MPTDPLQVCSLGVVEYREALELQHRLRARRQAGELPDTLLLLEHPPVYTRGRRSGSGELPMGEDWYRSQGIDAVNVAGGTFGWIDAGQPVDAEPGSGADPA